MSTFRKQAFSDVPVLIDGNDYVECRFEKCKIIFCGISNVSLLHCSFVDCEWAFDGPALRTAQFMTAIYAMGGGAQELIERTFDTIRGKPHPSIKPS